MQHPGDQFYHPCCSTLPSIPFNHGLERRTGQGAPEKCRYHWSLVQVRQNKLYEEERVKIGSIALESISCKDSDSHKSLQIKAKNVMALSDPMSAHATLRRTEICIQFSPNQASSERRPESSLYSRAPQVNVSFRYRHFRCAPVLKDSNQD